MDKKAEGDFPSAADQLLFSRFFDSLHNFIFVLTADADDEIRV